MAIDFSTLKKLSIAGIELKKLLINGIEIWKSFTNALSLAVDSSGSLFNDGKGYKDGYRLNSSGTESAASGRCVTGFIPIKSGDVLYLSNITMKPKSGNTGYNHVYVWLYKSDFSKLATSNSYISGNNNAFPDASEYLKYDSSGNVIELQVGAPIGNWQWLSSAQLSELAYVRFSAQSITSDSIVTINEEI